jgi:hypothetical protein
VSHKKSVANALIADGGNCSLNNGYASINLISAWRTMANLAASQNYPYKNTAKNARFNYHPIQKPVTAAAIRVLLVAACLNKTLVAPGCH